MFFIQVSQYSPISIVACSLSITELGRSPEYQNITWKTAYICHRHLKKANLGKSIMNFWLWAVIIFIHNHLFIILWAGFQLGVRKSDHHQLNYEMNGYFTFTLPIQRTVALLLMHLQPSKIQNLKNCANNRLLCFKNKKMNA